MVSDYRETVARVLPSRPSKPHIYWMLTWPYIHLLVNHFPVVLSAVGFASALGALIFRRRLLWIYAMLTLTFAGLVVYPVRLSGDEADEALHDPWYIRHGAIDEHDDASLYALIFLVLGGAVSAYGLWRIRKYPEEPIPVSVRSAVFVTSLIGFGVITYTAYLGGKIIHEAPVLMLPSAPANLPPGIATPSDSGGH